jgi:CheY-like chemotaxis protein
MTQGMRVWLIDDDVDDNFFFKAALGEIDNPVEFFTEQDSEAALSKLQDVNGLKPDLLFLDWNMPKFSGRECLKIIREMPSFASIPIIIYTTSSAYQDQIEAKRLGASYFLTKPTTVGELAQKLQHLFSLDWSNLPV